MTNIFTTINDIVNKPLNEAKYSKEEIEVANKTSRPCGAIGGAKAKVFQYVRDNIDKSLKILDFGAGKAASQTKLLREAGFENVTAYDFGINLIDGLHDKNAMKRKYDVVMASNVLNTQSSKEMLEDTVADIAKVVKRGGVFIANLPKNPRKFPELNADMLMEVLEKHFKHIERVDGTKGIPVLKATK